MEIQERRTRETKQSNLFVLPNVLHGQLRQRSADILCVTTESLLGFIATHTAYRFGKLSPTNHATEICKQQNDLRETRASVCISAAGACYGWVVTDMREMDVGMLSFLQGRAKMLGSLMQPITNGNCSSRISLK